jgi:hypothetical protein
MYNESNRLFTFAHPGAKEDQLRTCVWCDAPLPEPEQKGHRRREFCPPPKTCKQQHYLWHKQMKQDAANLAEPYWRIAYTALVEQFKLLECLLQQRLIDLEEERKRTDRFEERIQYYQKRYEALQADYAARLKALGMSEQDIKDFNKYWQAHLEEDEPS